MGMTTLKLFLFLVLLNFCYAGKDRPVFPPDIAELIKHVHNDCRDRIGISEEEIQNCEKGIFTGNRIMGCYAYCLAEEASIADETGVLDYDLWVSLMPTEYQERTRNMVFSCRYLADDYSIEKCARGVSFHKCMYEKDPEFYFLL